MTGAERLRATVRMADGCSESWNDQFHAEDLLRICRAIHLHGNAPSPETWTKEQMDDAIRYNLVPEFGGEK